MIYNSDVAKNVMYKPWRNNKFMAMLFHLEKKKTETKTAIEVTK